MRVLPLLGAVVTALALGGNAGSSAAACAPAVRDGVLPAWMRAGFSDPRPRSTYVLGRDGHMGGILWGATVLSSPPAKGVSNKVLWVARGAQGTSALWIRMQRMIGTRQIGAPVTHTIKGGPGPSSVDAPSPGCWRLSLSWSGRHDTVDLRYVSPTK